MDALLVLLMLLIAIILLAIIVLFLLVSEASPLTNGGNQVDTKYHYHDLFHLQQLYLLHQGRLLLILSFSILHQQNVFMTS